MKVIRMPASMGGGTQYAQVMTTTTGNSGIPQGVKVVKLAPGPITSNAHQYFQSRVSQVIYANPSCWQNLLVFYYLFLDEQLEVRYFIKLTRCFLLQSLRRIDLGSVCSSLCVGGYLARPCAKW